MPWRARPRAATRAAAGEVGAGCRRSGRRRSASCRSWRSDATAGRGWTAAAGHAPTCPAGTSTSEKTNKRIK